VQYPGRNGYTNELIIAIRRAQEGKTIRRHIPIEENGLKILVND
jgi:hypothetical protein